MNYQSNGDYARSPHNEKMPSATPTRSPSALPSVNKLPPAAGDPVSDLRTSQNAVAAGIGEALHALVLAASSPQTQTPNTPIMIECGERVMALGRKRMATMNGRNAFLYLKSKFGLLSSSNALYLSAKFPGDSKESDWVEIDMDAWDELVPFLDRLRIYS